jgi:hypothetical protein
MTASRRAGGDYLTDILVPGAGYPPGAFQHAAHPLTAERLRASANTRSDGWIYHEGYRALPKRTPC